MSTLDANGLSIDSLNQIIADLEDGNKAIYGNDIILASNSPDGQQINLYAQSVRDQLELIAQVNASFDLGEAIGTTLDQRATTLNIRRKGATFTQQQIEITVDRSLTLEGLDADANDPDGTGYTVADDTGTQFILLDTVNIVSAGTQNLTFRAKDLGSITTLPNTITNPVSVVIGVTNINNPTGALEVGTDGELDSVFRTRALASPANRSQGFIDGLTGTIFNLDGVTDVRVYENRTNVTDANGIPPHSIWVICEGGANTDIGNAIYTTISEGCGMRGAVILDIITVNGSLFSAKFDRPQSKDLWIRFDIKETVSGQVFDQDGIKQYITDNLNFSIGDSANTSSITTIAQEAIDDTSGGGVPLDVEISDDNITYVDFLETATLDEKWIVDNIRILITLI
jgi:uncharacterized phage protein gp47/JayE